MIPERFQRLLPRFPRRSAPGSDRIDSTVGNVSGQVGVGKNIVQIGSLTIHFPQPRIIGAVVAVLVAGGAVAAGAAYPRAPVLVVSPAEVAFDSVPAGGTGEPKELKVRNTGRGIVHVYGVDVNGEHFGKGGGSCERTRTLARGEHCTVRVAFVPRVEGTHRGQVRVRYGEDRVAEVALQGRATAYIGPELPPPPEEPVPAGTPWISVGTGLDFGTMTVGTSNTGSLPVANRGHAELRVVPRFDGAAGDFTVSEGDCASVPAGGTCNLQVTFYPRAEGLQDVILDVEHNAQGGPKRLHLRGQGTAAPLPALFLPDRRVPFRELFVGEADSVPVRIFNRGRAGMSVILSVSPETEGFAAGEGTCAGAALFPDGQCHAMVRFAPTRPGVSTA